MSNHSNKKGWGARSAWALSFFDIVPPTSSAPPPTVHSNESTVEGVAEGVPPPPTTSSAASLSNRKLRKQLAADPQTRWQCRRCHSLLHPPLDAATGRPRYGVMMCEHLEGTSSGGTTHLATGVTVCAAGPLQYVKQDVPSTPTPCVSQDSGECAGEAEDPLCSADSSHEASAPLHKGGQDVKANEVASARAAVSNLLWQCQRAALIDSGNTTSSGGGGGGGSSTARAPVPLLFVVVENPKTPANAGGILRAMKCYGIHGPAANSSSSTTLAHHAEEQLAAPPTLEERLERSGTTTSSGLSPSLPAAGDQDVLRRVGAFIFSGTRLQKALVHTDFTSSLRTDPTHASRDIPQLCLPSLDVLFDVLRSEFGHHSSSTAPPSSVQVVAVELVEGATPLPAFEHPFNYIGDGDSSAPSTTSLPDAARARQATAEKAACAPMVFYVFGAEDGTLSAHHIERDADDAVFVPTAGSMNLAATVNVLMYDRLSKEHCGLQPAERAKGKKWRGVFESRNANNRTRWARPN
ncbi:hypothetical protein ABL78_6329 [Leptomonas seymouri]|uniref:tRNA/rRNA methyltransferase SpoU type domain-containing protein n=1 Tax=Leptomonas seymouri TaxID=5684 RepID=A0A0N1IIC5_LEPSE|nr:hypothetical protein ABL78_6329 [Leptomonas seymouri]|eukprot:KPI84624.1 hypothetical protein ABL78_6329 [Leptomonas seymouri]